MKYLWRTLIIVLCVFIVIGFALLSRILPKSNNKFFTERSQNLSLVLENDFDLAKVNHIAIDYGAEDVEILPSESANLEIKEYMNYDPQENELTTLWRTGDTLEIKEGDTAQPVFSVFGKRKRIEIYIPQDYQDILSVDLGSGQLTIDMDMKLTELNLNISSGNVEIGKIEAERTEIDLASGYVEIEELTGTQNIDVASGNVEIKLAEGNGTYSCTSGGIDMNVSEVTGDIDIDVTSGRIEMELPNDSEFQYSSKVSSGSADTYFDTEETDEDEREAVIGDDPVNKIKVEVTSGNATLDDY